jgi:hypothetical protein
MEGKTPKSILSLPDIFPAKPKLFNSCKELGEELG